MNAVASVHKHILFFALALSCAAVTLTLHAGNTCSEFLEAGTGDPAVPDPPRSIAYTAQTARRLKVDLNMDVAIIVSPTLSAEYAISLQHDRPGGTKRRIVLSVQPYRSALPVIRSEDFLSENEATLLTQIWQRAIGEAKNRWSGEIGVDGESFVFSAGGRQAHIWEPTCGTPKTMVDIALLLRRIVLKRNIENKFDGDAHALLLKRLQDLDRDLPAAPKLD